MSVNYTSQNLSHLVINKVDSQATFNEMVQNNLVNEDELYLITSELEENSKEVFVIEFSATPDSNKLETAHYTVTTSTNYNDVVTAITENTPINAVISIGNGAVLSETGLVTYSNQGNITVCTFQSILDFWDSVNLKNNYYMATLYYRSNNTLELFLTPITTGGLSISTLTIGSYTYNGSQNVSIPVYDGTYTWG